ncbi:MAG: glycosyltransferase [Gammaproteobacteria bacterium]|nr:glycosyltransferase [Gammaproteobacteria bacterium]
MRPEKNIEVSVLMPVCNAAHTLHECLDSIFKQSLQNFEVIAVDDFSGDTSITVMQSYNDSRLVIIENKNKGIVSALNTGLAFCRSNYVARMDADDVMHEQRLQKQFELLRDNSEITLCATQAIKFPQDKIQAGYIEYMRWQNACLSMDDIQNQIYIESPFAHPSVMFRRNRVIEAGAYLDGDFPEDYELWLRMFQRGYKMVKLEQELMYWRESDSRLSRNCSRYSDAAFERLRANYLAKDPRLTGRRIVIWGAGRKTRQRVQLLIDQGISPVAWIDIDSRKIGLEYQGARTFWPDWLLQHEEKPFVLNYVRNHGAREKCRLYLDQAGYVMGQDYLDVA